MIVWLGEDAPAAAFGGKAASLSRARQAGLPVPDGFCVDTGGLEALESTREQLAVALERLTAAALAVRSSAIGEDGASASFAGIHCSLLNVTRDPDAALAALATVRASANSPGALEYRRRRGLDDQPARMAAVVQQLVVPDVAGVVFTRDPRSGAERYLVDASWGLGEAIASGLVIPDHWEVEPDGSYRTNQIGDKDIAVVPVAGGTGEMEVPTHKRKLACLSPDELASVVDLARRCEQLFDSPQDVEWALAGGALWLVQSRPITTG